MLESPSSQLRTLAQLGSGAKLPASMTSRELRQSFLDFFTEKKHTIVPSAPLMPTSPNLLFTNAGMNPFIPYFLGTEVAPFHPPRAADTQKCIRAGGKHNDLEDVGYDTYHHTFFEMLGNWSFGDYFKAEAISWAWELLTERWGFPAERLYATVYCPEEGDPASFDQEAHDHWAEFFTKAGLDPAIHIVNGNRKDNFWMMGETGPCGPCSELHIDLTPDGDTKGSLVNADDGRCIEIWNLVFIQFNANEDGSFRPLPACHVDTGMGFERACAVVQGTADFTDFSKLASNYNTDVFSPIFDKLSELSGHRYTATVPEDGRRHDLSAQELVDVAYRVIGDHVRTVAFAVSDGIEPGNGGRNYVIRNILRRGVRFGRILGFNAEEPFLCKLVPVLVREFGDTFPELVAKQDKIASVLEEEERQFNRTLDRGLHLFDDAVAKLTPGALFPAATVVKLWETYGFPTDLTQLLLDERRLSADQDEVARLVDVHRHTGAEGQKTTVVQAVSIDTDVKSEFVGYDADETDAEVLEWIENESGVFAIVDRNPLYIERGGQLGDLGELTIGTESIAVREALGVGDAAVLHLDKKPTTPADRVHLKIDTKRRRGLEAHHTATHLLHWALHRIVSLDAAQQGSLVAPDRLRFDFNSSAVKPDQIAKIEEEVNRCVLADDSVSVTEVPHSEVKNRKDVMQFFGDKYGELVRVVQIGGQVGALDGYSMELCGGTHVPSTAAVGYFKIKSEGAVAAGIRRVEAVCGDAAKDLIAEEADRLAKDLSEGSQKLATANAKLAELGKQPVAADAEDVLSASIHEALATNDLAKADALTKEFEKQCVSVHEAAVRAEKDVKKAAAGAAAGLAAQWFDSTLAGYTDTLWAGIVPGDSSALLQEAMNVVKARQFPGIAAMVIVEESTVHLGVVVHPDSASRAKAGDLVRQALSVVGGKGGGRPEMARGAASGGAPEAEAILAKLRELVG